MKLEAGDKIWVAARDDTGLDGDSGYYALLDGALFVEWSGTDFIGCKNAEGERVHWTLGQMHTLQQETNDNPDTRTNIDCMFEQLVGSGAL